MAGTTGLEPATSDVTGRRSNQLSYVPAFTSDNPFNISRHGNKAKGGRYVRRRKMEQAAYERPPVKKWCGREDLNLHEIAPASTSS